jgi:hypothetical protein
MMINEKQEATKRSMTSYLEGLVSSLSIWRPRSPFYQAASRKSSLAAELIFAFVASVTPNQSVTPAARSAAAWTGKKHFLMALQINAMP